MTDDQHTELSALRAELARVTAERNEALGAIMAEAMSQVEQELEDGEDCPDTWTLDIGGFAVRVECNAEHRSAVSAKIVKDIEA
jgi:hypothetical protein